MLKKPIVVGMKHLTLKKRSSKKKFIIIKYSFLRTNKLVEKYFLFQKCYIVTGNLSRSFPNLFYFIDDVFF